MNILNTNNKIFSRILFVVMLVVATLNPIKFHSQEIPILTQFTSQDFIINPAFTGDVFDKTIPFYITGREQWAGFTGGNPRTISIGAHGLINKVGLGGRVYRDEQGGAFSKNEIDFNIGIPVNLSKSSFLRFGLGGAVRSLRTDNNFENVDPSDPLLLQQESDVDLKTSFGLAYSGNFVDGSEYYRLNIGWSFNNVDPKRFSQPTSVGMFEMYGYFNFFAYNDFKRFEINYLNKWVRDLPMQGDLILLFGIQENVSLGFFNRFSYGSNYLRNSSNKYFLFGDALGPVVNFNLKKFSLGYSIDFTGSGMRNHSSGTHEIVLKICPTHENNPWLDDDNDGVPNYKDKELNTPYGALVNKDGVTLTDEMVAIQTKKKTSSNKLDDILLQTEFSLKNVSNKYETIKFSDDFKHIYSDGESYINLRKYWRGGNEGGFYIKVNNYEIDNNKLEYIIEVVKCSRDNCDEGPDDQVIESQKISSLTLLNSAPNGKEIKLKFAEGEFEKNKIYRVNIYSTNGKKDSKKLIFNIIRQ